MELYYSTSIENLNKVNEVIADLKKQINQENKAKYHVLLGEKMAETLDNITLNVPIQINTSIYEYSVNLLTTRINYATINSINSEYNFNVTGTMYIDEKKIYLGFRYINDFIKRDFSLLSKKGFKKEKEVPEGLMPLRISCVSPVIPDKEKIEYPTKNERIKTIARHSYENEYLNMSFCGESIPPYALMSAIDEVLISLDTPEAKQIIAKKETELNAILLDLEDEEVKKTLFDSKSITDNRTNK